MRRIFVRRQGAITGAWLFLVSVMATQRMDENTSKMVVGSAEITLAVVMSEAIEMGNPGAMMRWILQNPVRNVST